LFAYLSYRDAPAAIDWLEAIGFELVTRQPGDDGAVLHAELSRGDAVVMLASADADSTVHRASAARPVEGSNSRSTAALNRRSPTASSTIAPSSSLQAVNNPTHDARADDWPATASAAKAASPTSNAATDCDAVASKATTAPEPGSAGPS
jgi:hypothetical protein